jgi:hypothetical protein
MPENSIAEREARKVSAIVTFKTDDHSRFSYYTLATTPLIVLSTTRQVASVFWHLGLARFSLSCLWFRQFQNSETITGGTRPCATDSVRTRSTQNILQPTTRRLFTVSGELEAIVTQSFDSADRRFVILVKLRRCDLELVRERLKRLAMLSTQSRAYRS